eukprot:m.83974 g.83974  ORF g.83974 m.83974 type:complete len:1288 (+) comp9574_c0_seq1:153-4016(+)
MYFAVNFPREFSPDGAAALSNQLDPPLQVRQSGDGEQLAVLRGSVLHIWSCYPLSLLTTYTRSAESISEYGHNAMMQWSPDSAEIAVATTGGYLLVFELENSGTVNELRCENSSSVTSYAAVRNAVKFSGQASAYKPSTGWAGNKITALAGCRDALLVATAAGAIERFAWETHTFVASQTIVLQDVPFGGVDGIRPEVHVVQMDFAPSLRTLAIVLSSGAAACVLGETATLLADRGLRGVWAHRAATGGDSGSRAGKACQTALNTRFKLMAVGYDDGDICVYNLESHTTLGWSHTLRQQSGPTPAHRGAASSSGRGGGAALSGAVTALEFSSDGYCLAAGWKRGGVGTWSVFGARLMSLVDLEGESAMLAQDSDGVTSISWGPEGYALSTTLAKRSVVVQYQFVKSAMVRNSTSANQLNVVLQGEDRICISGDMGDVRFERGVDKLCDLQWQMIQIPDSYLWANWPIRYVAVDAFGQSIAVAGARGVAHYSVASRKWRLFGNESQEQTLRCSGGLAWWNDLLVVPCSNDDGTYEVRFYPRDVNLDNRNLVRTIRFGREILFINVCADRLLVYTASRRVQVFHLRRDVAPAVRPTGIGAVLSVTRFAHLGSVGSISEDTPPHTPTAAYNRSGDGSGDPMRRPSASSTVSDAFHDDSHAPHPSPRTPLQTLTGGTAASASDSPRSTFSAAAAAAAATFGAAATSSSSPRLGGSNRSGRQSGGLASVDLEWELSLKDEAAHSSNVISVALVTGTLGGLGSGSGAAGGSPTAHPGLIANISGHLLLYSPEATPECGVSVSSVSSEPKGAAVGGVDNTFGPPALLATGVENFWMQIPSESVRLARHLDEALWLGCGALGMKVWLPLYPAKNRPGLLPKRVMLPFHLDIYPLSVLLADAVVLGAGHDAFGYHGKERPFFAVARKTQPYLHHILRQLLRRNEEGHARRIAESCSHLSYFPHVMELMLHKVLEDERNENEGVSDAQLPKASKFLEGFPFFLETVVHCARKSDVAKWSKLFAATGPADELFERCIVTGQLHTASSYLLVLQSLQSPAASQQHALRILRLALDGENWDLARDLVRYLQATAGYVPLTDHEVQLAKQVELTSPKDTFHAALQDYALSVLKEHRLRPLAEFAARLQFPLLRWLRSIRTKHGLFLDVEPALKQALSDFGLPTTRHGSATDVHKREEVVYLLNVMFYARFYDWALLLSLMLLDEPGATRIFEEVAVDKASPDGVFGLLKRFKPLVEHKRLPAEHTALLEKLASNYRSAIPAPTDLERERPLSPDQGQCNVM